MKSTRPNAQHNDGSWANAALDTDSPVRMSLAANNNRMANYPGIPSVPHTGRWSGLTGGWSGPAGTTYGGWNIQATGSNNNNIHHNNHAGHGHWQSRHPQGGTN